MSRLQATITAGLLAGGFMALWVFADNLTKGDDTLSDCIDAKLEQAQKLNEEIAAELGTKPENVRLDNDIVGRATRECMRVQE